MGTKKVIHVCGWTGCSWFQRASHLASTLQLMYPTKETRRFESKLHESPVRDEYVAALPTHRSAVLKADKAQTHTASPFVYFSSDGTENTFIGGCDATVAWAKAEVAAAGGGAISKAATCAMVEDGFASGHGYDYDVVVIGGGSGGLATSKECARLGAKTACLDFVKPSPAGTTWGLGGTCVNVGCIPKKLMHTASILGEVIEKDAANFGWDEARCGAHSWEKLRVSVQSYIKSLNFKYRVALREGGVTYVNALGKFIDDHTLECTDKRGKVTQVTAARFIIAVGGRPSKLGCPGEEFAIDSDDLFSLGKAPGRTLCVGAGYVSLECGGFLAGLGYPVTCMVRSIALRGFDRECADKITQYMEGHGVRFQAGRTPAKIEKAASGALLVTDSIGETHEYDTVLCAVGRTADLSALSLDKVEGLAAAVSPKTKKLKVEHEQVPSAPHVYAVGDVIDGKPELTPVAIAAGLALARRLFDKSTEPMDYDTIPTTVFTPLEYGTIGLNEEVAKAALGEANVEIYISEFQPLEHALSEARADATGFAKLVVDKSDGGKVVGFHYLGPNAGEITQGFAVAMRKGATYDDFTSTVGIHPTIAEEFTTIAVTKASGASAAKGGC